MAKNKQRRQPVDVVTELLKKDKTISKLFTGSQVARLVANIVESLENEGWTFANLPKPSKVSKAITDPKFLGSNSEGW